jgi:hypothetical protein
MNTPPGAYSDAVSLERTGDGGYVLAGGTIGCGSGSDCPSLNGIQCGLIEKVDSAGGVVWAQVYSASPTSTAIEQLEPTSDGGFIAVGSASDSNQDPRALILKLDALGGIQWQRLGRSDVSHFIRRRAAHTTRTRGCRTGSCGYVARRAFSDNRAAAGDLTRQRVTVRPHS